MWWVLLSSTSDWFQTRFFERALPWVNRLSRLAIVVVGLGTLVHIAGG
jgi:hypothetical protein